MLNTYRTILSQKSQLNSDTYLFKFNLLDPKEIVFKPGQYVMLKVPSEKGLVSRLYSIASPNTMKNRLELIIEMVPGGLASNYLINLQENTEVTFQGPAGMFGLHENEKAKIFLVTGTGIAPVLSMINSQLPTTNYQLRTNLFWGLKNYKDVYLFDELKQLAINNQQLTINICLSRESSLDMISMEDRKYFSLGHVDICFEKLPTTNYELRTNFDFYLCGGRNIVESLKQNLLSKNIPAENLIFEKF